MIQINNTFHKIYIAFSRVSTIYMITLFYFIQVEINSI